MQTLNRRTQTNAAILEQADAKMKPTQRRHHGSNGTVHSICYYKCKGRTYGEINHGTAQKKGFNVTATPKTSTLSRRRRTRSNSAERSCRDREKFESVNRD